MEQSPFELTPQQKGMLASLLHETGKPVLTLVAAIAKALEELQDHDAPDPMQREAQGPEAEAAEAASRAPQQVCKPIWEVFAEAFKDVPEEELDSLPVDGAAQHDHYIYGWPKRPL